MKKPISMLKMGKFSCGEYGMCGKTICSAIVRPVVCIHIFSQLALLDSEKNVSMIKRMLPLICIIANRG